MLRHVLILAATLGFFTLAAMAADYVSETKPVTNPDGTMTLVEERHTILPQDNTSSGNVTINIDAQPGSTVNINTPGYGLSMPQWLFDLRLPRFEVLEPRIVPTVAELETICHFNSATAQKAVANIGIYTTVERLAFDGYWRKHPEWSESVRNSNYRKGCAIIASRFDDF